MTEFADAIRAGLARGWKVHGGPHAAAPATLSCDVAIIGSGAGITAELLTSAGLSVVLIEEGPLRSSSDFRQIEAEAYTTLYQDSASRQTADKAINILQGRCVGGSTTVNWTRSFRTPASTLQYWREHFALPELTDSAMSPWFPQAEQRLNIGTWLVPPNVNNELLKTGAARLGIPAAAIQRNVKGCWNLGSCGMGCPTNAKQSMPVTTLPTALDRGATLLVQMRAHKLALAHGKVQAVQCIPIAVNGAVLPGADSEETPQSMVTDHFLEVNPVDGPIGYKLEAPPLHPVLASTTLPGFGVQQAQAMKDFPNTHALLALLRDGFHEQASGGKVKLRRDGTPVLDYSLTPCIVDGARRVTPGHEAAMPYTKWAQARSAIAGLQVVPYPTRVVSAHVMGGCGMAGKAEPGVVQPDGRHWQVENLSVHDGSLFSTRIGANPQLWVYGLVNKLATGLARALSGRDVRLALRN